VSEAFDLLDPGPTRGEFLRRLVVGGGALLTGGTVVAEFAPPARAAASSSRDTAILNAALVLEELGASFYGQALQHGGLGGETLTFVQTVHAHEVAHAAFVRRLLGAAAKPAPRFSFGDRTASEASVQHTAMMLEGLCTEALVGVAPLLTRRTLGKAGALLPVEARHVAWITAIVHGNPAPSAFQAGTTLTHARAATRAFAHA
jgi:hypothetical protein